MNPKPSIARRIVTIGLPVATFIAGAGIAGAAAATPETITETETVTETVEAIPQACLDALDHSESLFIKFADALDIAGDSIMAAVNFDLDALDEGTAKLEEMTPEVADIRSDYDAAATECRAS